MCGLEGPGHGGTSLGNPKQRPQWVEECLGAAGCSCSALTPFVSVPRSKAVQNKVDSILVSASVAHCAEGEGMMRLHLAPLAELNPDVCPSLFPIGVRIWLLGLAPRAPHHPAWGVAPAAQALCGKTPSCDFGCPGPSHAAMLMLMEGLWFQCPISYCCYPCSLLWILNLSLSLVRSPCGPFGCSKTSRSSQTMTSSISTSSCRRDRAWGRRGGCWSEPGPWPGCGDDGGG